MKITLDNLSFYADEVGDCMLWRGSVGGHGYPQAICERSKPCVLVKNHIFTRLLGKELPAKRVIALSCGNKRCIAPNHIVPMSRKAVVLLAYKQDKRPRGNYAAQYKARMDSPLPSASPEQVRAIRAYPPEVTHQAIAEAVGLGHKAVSRIRRGLTHREAAKNSSVWAWSA